MTTSCLTPARMASRHLSGIAGHSHRVFFHTGLLTAMALEISSSSVPGVPLPSGRWRVSYPHVQRVMDDLTKGFVELRTGELSFRDDQGSSPQPGEYSSRNAVQKSRS